MGCGVEGLSWTEIAKQLGLLRRTIQQRARNGREAELHCTINVNVAVCFNVPELPVDLIL